MIKLKDMIARSLFVESKKLRVFDFDDTLVKTTSYIYVKLPSGKEKKLTPGQYAVYNEKPGEEYDFRDFYSVQNPQEFKKVTKRLKTLKRESVVLEYRERAKELRRLIKEEREKNSWSSK